MRRILLFIFILQSVALCSQNYTISGILTEESSGETLIQATVFDSISGKGAVTNAHGFYSLTLHKGAVKLFYSYIGLNNEVHSFILKRDTTISLPLETSIELSEVTVIGNRTEMGVHGSQMSAIEVPISQIKNVPSLAGEIDVIKALQLLPGVQSGSEGSSGLYVRGGGPDQNLILLDGVPLYNINHMLGFFSVFNADAIKNVTLYKGSFPARFGGRLSSVVDVRQNDGNARHYHGSVTIGLLSGKINVEGPIIKDKTTFNLSARRTYFDLLTRPTLAIAQKNNKSESLLGGYYFYDINAKVSHKFSDRNRLSLTYYMGDDAITAKMKDKYKRVTKTRHNTTQTDWRWGNIVSTLNWSHQFNNKLFANTNVAYTRYRFNIGFKLQEYQKTIDENNGEQVHYSNSMSMKHKSSIDDWSIASNYEYTPHPNHEIKFGGNYIFHSFKPAVTARAYNEKSNTSNSTMDTTIGDSRLYSHEAALYIEDNWSIHRIVKLNIGLRGSIYSVTNKTYPSIEPRVSMRFLITNDLSAKAAYSYVTQYTHLLSNSNLTLPTDLWVPVTARIEPMNSHQVTAGFFYNLLNQIDLSVEGYYKTMNNLIEYKDGASFFGSSSGWEDKVVSGKGWSYGIEFLAQRKIGKLTGWLGYTWSKTQRQFDRPGQIINYGEPFYAKYDRRHDLSITLSYAINDKMDIASTFIYGTGICGTLGLQTYKTIDYYSSTNHIFEGNSTYIPERNNYRMPSYHRLDVGMNFYRYPKVGKSIWNISIYNIYNNLNPFLVYSQYSGNRRVLYKLSIFPIIPSVSYTYQF